ncbi:unnamed protein product, partial [Polarella glacialis]
AARSCGKTGRSCGRLFLAVGVSFLAGAAPSFLSAALPCRSSPAPLRANSAALVAGPRPLTNGLYRVQAQAAGSAESRSTRVQRWRNRAAAAAALASSLLWPHAAWARVAKKYVSRADERRAGYFTAGCFVLFFVFAYFNSQKEDRSEDQRIKNEVQRLVRLKKEFEESEENE